MRIRAASGKGTREPCFKTLRPPCRQSDNIFDLDDSQKIVRKPIRIIRKQVRPPSRHKTPPKALGLELPPKDLNTHIPDQIPINQFSMSQPINFSKLNSQLKDWKPRADSVKGKNKNEAILSSRAWSAKESEKKAKALITKRNIETSQREGNERGKRNASRVKQQNLPIFSGLQTEFLDLFA